MTSNKIVTFIDDDKNTKLHYAAVKGDLGEIKTELENNSEIDPINYLGWTPLMMATRYGHIDAVKLLLDKLADATRTNNFGFNILLMAVASGNLDLIYLILQHLLCGGVSKQSMQSIFSPVSLAVLFNNTNVLEYLLDNGFCINATTPLTELTPIMFANALRNTEIINLLQKKGAKNVNNCMNTQQSNSSQKCTKVPHPLILLNSNPINSQPSYVCVQQNGPMPRRCSDLVSPYFTPNITPMTSGVIYHQVFFPQNFSPNQYFSPVNAVPVYNSNEFLNVRLIPESSYFQPFNIGE
ncbi:hypothetical protein FQA39_LY06701 [Lamprigera yunnana]|nr:hypothetical protein FQA39_LY06701 [Lamprigera yunnana]